MQGIEGFFLFSSVVPKMESMSSMAESYSLPAYLEPRFPDELLTSYEQMLIKSLADHHS